MPGSVSESPSRERLVTGPTGRVLVSLSLGRLVLPPLLPTITADLGITPSRARLLISVMGACFALSQ